MKRHIPRGKHVHPTTMLYLGSHANTRWVAPIIRPTSYTIRLGVRASLEKEVLGR